MSKVIFSLGTEGTKRAIPKREEATLQARLFKDLQILLPRDAFVFAVPNGGKRNVIEAVNLKRQGVVAGIPDLVLIYRGKAFGLELKAKNGSLQDSQRDTFPKLQGAGMRIEVARSHSEAIERIKEMGIPLSLIESTKYDVQNVFRDATRRRA